MTSFLEWLNRQKDRSDSIGDLARNLGPNPPATYGCLRQYLSGCDADLRALDLAWREYARPKSLMDF